MIKDAPIVPVEDDYQTKDMAEIIENKLITSFGLVTIGMTDVLRIVLEDGNYILFDGGSSSGSGFGMAELYTEEGEFIDDIYYGER